MDVLQERASLGKPRGSWDEEIVRTRVGGCGGRRRLGGRHETLQAETREWPGGGFSH